MMIILSKFDDDWTKTVASRVLVKSWKNLVNTLEATVLVQSSSNLLRMIILTISHSVSNMGDGSKTRSVGQTMEKPC